MNQSTNSSARTRMDVFCISPDLTFLYTFFNNRMKWCFQNDKSTEIGPLFSTWVNVTNCLWVRLKFLPSIRVSILKSAKLKRIPFYLLHKIGKHVPLESNGYNSKHGFMKCWFIFLNQEGYKRSQCYFCIIYLFKCQNYIMYIH